MGKVNTNGKMVQVTQATSKMVKKKVTENGKNTNNQTVIHMKVSFLLIWNMGKESSHGTQETYTKVGMKKTKEMDTERCIGMMEVFIKGTG